MSIIKILSFIDKRNTKKYIFLKDYKGVGPYTVLYPNNSRIYQKESWYNETSL